MQDYVLKLNKFINNIENEKNNFNNDCVVYRIEYASTREKK